MKFKKEFLQEMVWGDDVVEDNIVDNSRWSIHHEIVFRHEGKFYGTGYSVGATESQDERPFEYDNDEIECPEMVQKEKLVKVWEKA